MQERFMLMNRLYQLIVADQAGIKLPETNDKIDQHARNVIEAIAATAARTVYTSGGNKHEVMLQLAKLYTAGLITFERDKGGEFAPKAVKEPNLQDLEEFNDNIQR